MTDIDLSIPPELDRRKEVSIEYTESTITLPFAATIHEPPELGSMPALKSVARPKSADAPDGIVNAADWPKSTDDPADIIGEGQAAWKRIKGDPRRTWEDWLRVGWALLAGREWAQSQAHTNSHRTKPYREQFGLWLQMTEFDLHKSVRADLLSVMEQLTDIELWRGELDERDGLNHPTTVMRAFREWKCPARGNRGEPKSGKRRNVKSKRHDEYGDAEQHHDETEAETGSWGKFAVWCNRLLGFAAIIEDSDDRPGPNQGQIDLAREAGKALLAWADHFEELATVKERTATHKARRASRAKKGAA